MADSVVRLRIDSQEYDAKLKNATSALTRYFDAVRQGGDTLEHLDEGVMDAVKSFGNMETKANSTKSRLNELTQAFTEMSMQYKQLTDEERATPLGAEMSRSLDTLRDRIVSTKSDLDSINQSLSSTTGSGNDAGGMLDALASKFTINIDALKLFDIGLKAAKGALDVAKDAFMSSESNVDEWGRTVASCESLYKSFMNSINTGDISGFLSNIDQIVTAAKAAYNELDRLGTMKTIQGPQISAQETENQRLRGMIMTGKFIAPYDGHRVVDSKGQPLVPGQQLTPGQIRYFEGQLTKGMNTLVTLTGNEIKQTGRAIDAVYNRQAKEIGIGLKEFRKGTSSMAEFDKRIEGYNNYIQFRKEQIAQITKNGGAQALNVGGDLDRFNPYRQYKNWGVFRVDGEDYNNLVNLIKQRDQQASQSYSMQMQAYRTINRAEGITVRNIMNGGSGGTGRGSGSGRNAPETPAQKAANDVAKAEKGYADTINSAQLKLAEQMIKSEDYDKQVLNGQQKLADAYLAAYNATGDEKYLNSFRETAERVLEMQGVVDANAQAQKDAAEAAKQLAEAEKAAAAQMARMDLYNSYSSTGMSAFIGDRQKALGSAEYGSDEYNDIYSNIVDATTLSNLIKVAIQNGVDLSSTGVDTKALWERIVAGDNIEDADWESLVAKINEQLEAMDLAPIKLNFDTGNVVDDANKFDKTWKAAAQSIQQVGRAISSIEDPAAKIAGTVAQAIANIALGYSQAMTMVEQTGGPWGWIAFAATGLATMLSTISAIHNATGYAEGGIIKGNSYSGDNIPADTFVNAGELVLNRSQQGALAEQLTESNSSGMIAGSPYVTGETIFLGLSNYLRRNGYGELITTRARR